MLGRWDKRVILTRTIRIAEEERGGVVLRGAEYGKRYRCWHGGGGGTRAKRHREGGSNQGPAVGRHQAVRKSRIREQGGSCEKKKALMERGGSPGVLKCAGGTGNWTRQKD